MIKDQDYALSIYTNMLINYIIKDSKIKKYI